MGVLNCDPRPIISKHSLVKCHLVHMGKVRHHCYARWSIFFFIFKYSIAGKGDAGSSGFEVTTRAIWFKSRFSNGRTEVRAGGVRWRG